MSESAVSVFERMVMAEPPADGPVLFDTACVLGGSVAGLLAARVLADHARQVVILERDDVSLVGPRRGVPQDQQVHTLLPAGRLWIERWLPGFTVEVVDRGANLAGADQSWIGVDSSRQPPGGNNHELLAMSRPLLEDHLRSRVTGLPNVSILRARATGLHYRDGGASAVRYVADDADKVLSVDFVVDAMGRSSRLSEWLRRDGYEQPVLERLPASINYATALFDRPVPDANLDIVSVLAIFTPQNSPDGVSVAAASAIEDGQWIVMLMGYGDGRPGTTIDAFRASCAKLPSVFGEAASGAISRDIVTYHQSDSRRRSFTGLTEFPARLVSVGDAVASFNPVYGQGMSSAALHASCLSSYLNGGPDLHSAASEFFHQQGVVVDAAWAVSAGGDAARLDAAHEMDVSADVRQQRWAMEQIVAATLVDASVALAFNGVSFMLRHPATLADPALLARAIDVSAGIGSGAQRSSCSHIQHVRRFYRD